MASVPFESHHPAKTTVPVNVPHEPGAEWFARIPVPAWVVDGQRGRCLQANAAATAVYGYTQEEFQKMELGDLLAPVDREAFKLAVAGPKTHSRVPGQWSHSRRGRADIQVELTWTPFAFAGKAAALVLATDVTDLVRSEKRAVVFSDLGRRLSSARTAKEAALAIVDAADALFGWDSCLFGLCSPDKFKLATVLAVDTVNGQRTEVPTNDDLPGPITSQALKEGERLILRSPGDVPPETAGRFGDKSRASRSLMTVQVRNNEMTVGVLTVQSYSPNAYAARDLQTLKALASHCAGALDRIRAEEEILRLNAELERRVRDRTRQLEAINRELEAFSYSVSHDLRAPLRSIRGFSELLMERYGDQLDARGQEFLNRACESCGHMDRLIDDLLKLSRVGRSELQRARVDLSAIAASLAGELRNAEPGRSVEFVISPGLKAFGDERLLRVALDNLLRNAWKFTRHQPHPKIEFGRTEDERDHSTFFVSDNGAGFDMAYASKLFGVFQRLHSASEFPGTGIGLATFQRIIRRHGGRAWALGVVNEGATFYFTLPHESDT